MTQKFEFTQEELLIIVTALGTLKNRVGQKSRWLQRKCMPTLRHRLADNITIGDDMEIADIRRAMARTTHCIERRIKYGKAIGILQRRIKEQAGITDEIHYFEDGDTPED